MCGIAGWVDWADDLSNQRSLLEKMACTMEKRGPDAEGLWLSTHAAFAHRRLIVIDALGGAQPMRYENGSQTYVVTYNGELYNFKEIRQELQTRGHSFQTNSDTEVLLHTYAEWGESCVQHFNGIFAFAIWDEQRQRLFMGRDHLGVKPLFYAQRGGALIFGSELKALLAHPRVKSEVGAEGLAELFSFGPMRNPDAAIYKDVHELRPGHTLTFTRNNLQVVRYWNVRSAPHTDDVDTTAARIRDLIEDTVRHQLISDMPLVTLLSGGLDSSGLTSLAAREFRREHKTLDTYSMDFVDSSQDFEASALRPSLDAPWVQRVSEYAGTRHHTVLLDTPDLIENHLVSLYAHDLPGMGQMETSLYLLFKEMKKHATVALSGESADEVFGGYPWFREIVERGEESSMAQMMNRRETLLLSELEERINIADYRLEKRKQLLAEAPTLPGEDEHTTRIRQLFYQHLMCFLPMLLNRKDRMSMAVGFEVRVPFCDYRLVEYVWNIPWEMKNVDNIEKGILRRAFKDALPDDARMRRKSAYPSTQNQTFYKAMQDWVQHILDDPQQPVHQLIDKRKVQYVLSGQFTGGVSNNEASGYMMNTVIQTNEWLKQYHVSINL